MTEMLGIVVNAMIGKIFAALIKKERLVIFLIFIN